MGGAKKSERTLQREQGLERTDNGLDFTIWPEPNIINQKNYYTEYIKRDDQILPLRLIQEERRARLAAQHRDRDRARNIDTSMVDIEELEDDIEEDAAGGNYDQEFASGTDVVVIHPGSQNLRIGFASDILPKTVPMVIARQWNCNEQEERSGIVIPAREDNATPIGRHAFGENFASEYDTISSMLKTQMRQNKRKILPNSKELVVNFNDRVVLDIINEHNDPHRVDWLEISKNQAPAYVCGEAAFRIPDESTPRYKLFWPLKYGLFNEDDYSNKQQLFDDFDTIIEEALTKELKLRRPDFKKYGCIFIVPDLHDRAYVNQCMDLIMRVFEFDRLILIQESLAATIGTGNSGGCFVDIGAQKTSISCVEDGIIAPDSRVNIKTGGADVTELFVKMMLFDHFPYRDINLKRRYDFLLGEELKQKFCTMKEDDINVQNYTFHVRAPGHQTKKYSFKTFDEPFLAPYGLIATSILDNSSKLRGRRTLVEASVDIYESFRNDPVSDAQSAIYNGILNESGIATNGTTGLNGINASNGTNGTNGVTTNGSETPRPTNPALNIIRNTESARETPAIEDDGTPIPQGPGDDSILPQQQGMASCLRDDVVPIIGLDKAILTSIAGAAKNDDKKFRDYLKAITVVGGAIKTPGLDFALEIALLRSRPQADIRIIPPSKEIDPQVVVWKGASVQARVKTTNEYWISRLEWDRLGARVLHHKCMWSW